MRNLRAIPSFLHLKMEKRGSVFLGVTLLCVWVLFGMAGLIFVEDYSVLEAFYMSVITISTVGFHEVRPLSPSGQLFISFLIFAGLATALYTLTALGQLVLEGELAEILGQRRMKSELEKLENHYIVCGYGRVGKTVVEGLTEQGIEFCVLEKDPAVEEELRASEIIYLIGDSTDDSQLEAAGITRAAGLLALLPSDADNLYLTLTARVLNPDLAIVTRASDEKAEIKLKRGGADHVVSPYRIAGLRLLHAAINPAVVELMEIVTHRQYLHLNLSEIRVCEGSALANRSIAEAEVRKRYGVIIVAIKKTTGDMIFNPDPLEKVSVDDTLVALGKDADIRKLEEACEAG